MKGYGYLRYTPDGNLTYIDQPVPKAMQKTDTLSWGLFSPTRRRDTHTIGPYQLRYHSLARSTSGLPVDRYVSGEVWLDEQLCRFTNPIFQLYKSIFSVLGIVMTPPGVTYGRAIYYDIPLADFDNTTREKSERGIGSILEVYRGLEVMVGGKMNLQMSVMTQDNPLPAYNPEFSRRLVPWMLLTITVENLPTEWTERL